MHFHGTFHTLANILKTFHYVTKIAQPAHATDDKCRPKYPQQQFTLNTKTRPPVRCCSPCVNGNFGENSGWMEKLANT